MATPNKTVTTWDEHGNPVDASNSFHSSVGAWDENGKPIPTTLEIPDATAQAGEEQSARNKKTMAPAVRAATLDEKTPWYDRPAAGFKMAGERLSQKAEAAQEERLHHVAAGEEDTGPGAFYDLGARTLKTIGGLITPKSAGIAAGAVLAPEIVGPALVGHGLYTAGKHASGAYNELVGPGRLIPIGSGSTAPHPGEPGAETEATLGGLGEAAGGGAVAGGGFSSWGTKNPTLIGRGAGIVKQITGKARLSPVEASTVPAAAEFQPAFGVTPGEVLHHAAKEGIELTPGQGTQLPVSKMVQAIGERDLTGSKSLAEGIDKNAAAFMKSVTGFAERMDPQRLGTSDEAAGEAIRQGTETAKDVSHENASNAYKNLAKFDVDPSPIAKAWIKNRGALPTGIEDQILAQVPRDMKAHVAEIMDPSGTAPKLTSDQAINLRSLFLDLGRTMGADLPTRAQGVFKTMSKAADSALESDSRAAGVEKEWRGANAGWKEHIGKYGDKSSPLYRILDQADPKKITRDLMNRKSAADIEILKNEKLDPALEALRGRVVADIAKRKFTVDREGIGGYSDAFLKTLFGPEAAHELYIKGEIGRRFNFQMNPSGTSNVMIGESQIVHPTPSKIGLMAGSSRLSRPRPATDYLPEHVYRVRDQGAPQINPAAHSHATMTLEDAQRLAPSRGRLTGTPQEIQRIPLSRFSPRDYSMRQGPSGSNWIQFHRQLGAEDYLPLEAPGAPRRLSSIASAETGESQGRRRLPRVAGRTH